MSRPKSPYLSAEFSTIAHATEDIARVEKAVRFIVEELTGAMPTTTRQYLKGHYGNVITTIAVKLPQKELHSDVLRLLSGVLTNSDKGFFSNTMSSYLDTDRNLYLRFDKQEAFLGNVRLGEGDPVRLKLKFAPSLDISRIAAMCRECGLVP